MASPHMDSEPDVCVCLSRGCLILFAY